MIKKQLSLILVIFTLSFAVPVAAEQFISVSVLDDSGQGSLRTAFNQINAGDDSDITVTFDLDPPCSTTVPCVIQLASPLPTISIANQFFPNVTITGPGWNSLIIDGQGASRIMRFENDGFFVITGMTLRNGNASFDAQSVDIANGLGGAVYIKDNGSPVSFDFHHVKFENNQAGSAGGAVYTASSSVDFHISDTWFKNNTVTGTDLAGKGGGAIAAYLIGDMKTSWFDNNTSALGGGAISVLGSGGYIFAQSNTFSHNTASALNGGAISVDGVVYLEKNTFYMNSANAGAGGAVYQSGSSNSPANSINNNTITQNSALSGGGLSLDSGFRVGMSANIFAGNSVTANGQDIDESRGGILATGVSGGYNKIGQSFATQSFIDYFAGTQDEDGFGQPLLQTCNDYGYEIGRLIDTQFDSVPQTFPLPICPPLLASSLVDIIPDGSSNPSCNANTKDQVGTQRQGLACDIGAIEVGDPLFKNTFEF